MKIIIILSIILFVIALSIFTAAFISSIFRGAVPAEAQDITKASLETVPETSAPPKPGIDTIDKENITAIEIYLDGDRDHGILLGEAEYPIKSPEAAAIFGDDFSAAGYRLVWENTDYAFEPGSVHYLYVYAYLPAHGWQFIRERVDIPGDPNFSEDLVLYIDGPREGERVSGPFEIKGWAADMRRPDNPLISHIDIFLNGPRSFGLFLGNASLQMQRPDVAEVLGNENYLFTGYQFAFDAAALKPGSLNTFYVYAYSDTADYLLEKIELLAEGIKSEKAQIHLEDNFSDVLSSKTVELTGWALRVD